MLQVTDCGKKYFLVMENYELNQVWKKLLRNDLLRSLLFLSLGDNSRNAVGTLSINQMYTL